MDVRGGYEGLQYRYNLNDVNDPDDCEWQDINPSEFIVHAANLHIFRTGSDEPLWSSRFAPSGRAPTLSPDLK